MDSFIEVPSGYSAFDILDGIAGDMTQTAAAQLAEPHGAVSAWQEALAAQLTSVIDEWITRTTLPPPRH